MSLRHSARLAVLAVALAALLLPVTAHAEKVVTDDAVGDARKANWGQLDVETDPLFIAAPEETSTDITRTVVAHGEKRLSITVHFRDLVRITDHSTFVRVHTPSEGRFDLGLDKEQASRSSVSLGTRSGDVDCQGLRGTLDRDDDRVTLSVPTACLGNPRWVQLGVGAIGVTTPAGDQEPFDFDLFVDDGHRTTLSNQSLGTGPRVHRA